METVMMNGKIILTSFGMHTKLGYRKIAQSLPKEECEGATILLIVLPKHNLDEELIFWCQALGFGRDDITVFHSEEAESIKQQYFDVIYVSEGNTFEMLDYIRKNDLIKFIKESVYQGTCYIGASAGAHIAGMDVEAARAVEENYIGLTDFKALRLFHGIAIPHFEYGDRARYEAYKRALDSGKYAYVATIANDEVEVISKEFHKILCEHACSKVEKESVEKLQVGIGMKFEVKDITGEHYEAELLTVVECEGKEYAIYSIDNKDDTYDVLASYVLQDEDGYDYLKDIDNAEDKEKIEAFIFELMGVKKP